MDGWNDTVDKRMDMEGGMDEQMMLQQVKSTLSNKWAKKFDWYLLEEVSAIELLLSFGLINFSGSFMILMRSVGFIIMRTGRSANIQMDNFTDR